jgi:hypothetical protein
MMNTVAGPCALVEFHKTVRDSILWSLPSHEAQATADTTKVAIHQHGAVKRGDNTTARTIR